MHFCALNRESLSVKNYHGSSNFYHLIEIRCAHGPGDDWTPLAYAVICNVCFPRIKQQNAMQRALTALQSAQQKTLNYSDDACGVVACGCQLAAQQEKDQIFWLYIQV